MFTPSPGMALLVETPTQTNKNLKHLFILLTKTFNNEVIVVNVSTCKPLRNDESCILNKEDHPFIKHESYIAYHRSGILKTTQLEKMMKRQDGQIRPDVLNRITTGLMNSKKTPYKVMKFYMDYINQ